MANETPKPLVTVMIAYGPQGHASEHYNSLKDARDEFVALFDHLIAGGSFNDFKYTPPAEMAAPAPTPVQTVVDTPDGPQVVQAPGPLTGPGNFVDGNPDITITNAPTEDNFAWGTDAAETTPEPATALNDVAAVEAELNQWLASDAPDQLMNLLAQEEQLKAQAETLMPPGLVQQAHDGMPMQWAPQPTPAVEPDPVQAVWQHVETNTPVVDPTVLQAPTPAPGLTPAAATEDFCNTLISNLGFTVAQVTEPKEGVTVLVREGVVFQVIQTPNGFKVFYDAQDKWGKNLEVNTAGITDWGTALGGLLSHSAEAYGVIKSSLPVAPIQAQPALAQAQF